MSYLPRQGVVVCAVVVLMVGAIAPTVGPAGGQASAEASQTRAAEPPEPAPDPDGSARQRKAAAVAILEALDVDRRSQRRHRDRAIDLLRDSIAEHRDGDRVRTRRAFRLDRRALVAITRLARTNRSAVEGASTLVVEADRATASTAIGDAKRALRRFGGQLDRPRDRRHVERLIERAERARDRGRRAIDRSEGRSAALAGRTRAVVRFRTAWRRAQRALDRLDRAAEPVVTITSRTDPPWNGSATTRAIRGNLSAVRPFDVQDPTVWVNGSPAGTAQLDAPAAPARTASFAANVTLDGPVAEVTVSVAERAEDHGRERDERSRRHHGRRGTPHDDGSDPDRRDHDGGEEERHEDDERNRAGRGTEHDADITSAVVRFDGDGLPDIYESSVVRTDPLNPDSDSTRTAASEAGNGTLDGGEDLDADGLVTYAELVRGTDPFALDTDADGLADRFEASLPSLDATSADTDGDGVPDGQEDYDGDRLVAADELAFGTSIATTDTDYDGLDDEEEVRRYETSPLSPDTDEDGLGDGVEVDLGTDSTDRDTDADGIVDGAETYTTRATDPGTGVAVSTVGSGHAGRELTVEPVRQPAGLDVTAGPVVRIRNRTGFERATVSVPISADVPVSGNLSVFTWSPGSDRPWHPLPSTVDRVNRTVAADVSSFSYFTVMDERRWREVTRAVVPADWPRFEGFQALEGWAVEGSASVENGSLVVAGRDGADIVVAVDGSGDFTRIQPAVTAAKEGDTVVVRRGTYAEEVVLDRSIRLRGENATLDAAGLGGEPVGVQVTGDTEVTLSGLTIEGFERGVAGLSTAGDVILDGVTFRDTRYPVVAGASAGDWYLTGVVARGTGGFAVRASASEGDWTIAGSDLVDGGVLADSAAGDWTVANTTVAGKYDGIDAWEATGEWTIRDTRLSGSEDGLDANGATGDFTLVDVDASGNERGIGGFLTSGDWTVLGTDLDGNEDYGIYSGYATGNWTVRATDVSGNGFTGISAEHATGEWRLDDLAASGNGNTGVDAYETAGDWRLSNVEASRNAGWTGVDAYGSSGNWTVSNVGLSNNGMDGLASAAASGRWRVSRAVIRGNGANGVDAAAAVGDISIAHSAIHGNGQAGVNGDGAARTILATAVWWGRPGGPSAGQVKGNVVVETPCASGDCATGGEVVGPLDGPSTPGPEPTASPTGPVAAGEVSRARREVALPAGSTNVTIIAGVRGAAQPGGPAELRLLTDGGPVAAVELDAAVNHTREITTSLGRLTGGTAAIEVVAEKGARVAVDWIDVAFDTDGDGFRDLVEEAKLALPAGPVPGAPLAALDPTDPDSDGDGIPDGEELTNVSLRRPTESGSDSFVVRPTAARANPTSANSDGGGLNDSEERARGSDPFVLETLVAGYAIPTMTEGPNATVEDGNPMTVAEARGLQIGGGRESDLMAWPSRQYFDPVFCIAELTAGPGCAPGWMRGVEIRDDHHYVYVPFLVYLQSNVDVDAVPYEVSFSSPFTAKPVKAVNASGLLERGAARRGYVVYELPDHFVGAEGQPGGFRSLGKLSISVDTSTSIFDRSHDATVGRGYSVSTSTLLPKTERLLEDTRFVLSEGLTIATATESGYAVAVTTGSLAKGALAFLYELAIGQIDIPPRSARDLGRETAEKGIASFEQEVRETEGQIRQDVFGNGTVKPVGPTIIRQN